LKSKSIHRQAIGAERLEGRALLAGDVHAGVDLGLLSVVGDEADNAVVVTQRLERVRTADGVTGLRVAVVVTGLWKGGAPTTVNGAASASFPARDVSDVVIDMAGGDDRATAANLRLTGALGMDGGDFGNDVITVAGCRVARLGVRMGPGNDLLAVVGTHADGITLLSGEDGRDALIVLGSTFGSVEIRGFEFQFPRTIA
jgi:hypothetical protein